MTTTNIWLPLTDYSTKYKVSVSTLRRRIKTEDICFRLEDGKYFIVDDPIDTNAKWHRPSLNSAPLPEAVVSQKKDVSSDPADVTVLEVANKLVLELKRAYTKILSGNEEQMLLLKEEISDLRTLVRVLESENERLKAMNI